MLVTKVSPFSGEKHTLDLPITTRDLRIWNHGVPIQDAMPQLTANQREFLMTGITADEWDEAFSSKYWTE